MITTTKQNSTTIGSTCRTGPALKSTRKEARNYQDELLSILVVGALFAYLMNQSDHSIAFKLLLTFSGAIILGLVVILLVVTRFPKARPLEPIRAAQFRPSAVPKKLDTIIIGSGSGGSTCASLLAQAGKKVLVLEQHDKKTGGCTHSFREKGCEWDTGLHYTCKAMSEKTSRPGAIMDFVTRGKQAWNPLDDPYDEILFPRQPSTSVKEGAPNNNSYSFLSGPENAVKAIVDNIDPKDDKLRTRALRYMEICKDINEGFTALGISRVLPSWLHFLVRKKLDRMLRYASMTVRDVQHAVFNLGYTKEELLENCPKAPEGSDPDPSVQRLKGIMCHPIGDYAVQPREATMAAHGVTMAHYFAGGAYTVGATQNISIRATSMVRSFGGEVLIDATVRGIIVENGRAVGVQVSNTSALAACKSEDEKAKVPITEIRARSIVCATSIYNLYSKFLPQDLPVVQTFHDPAKRSVRQSNGHVFLFCKIKGDATELGLPTHNLWYFNGYDLDRAFDEYFANPTEVRPPTVYIGFPCTKDTTWKKRFPGVSNCILISDGLYEWFEKWADSHSRNRGEEYIAFKDKLTKHLLDILFETVPQLQGKVVFHHLGTPLSEISYLASFRGGSYGTKCVTDMFAPINREWTTTPHTQIKGLYLAGSDAFLPSVVGAMYGGCLGACAVLGTLGTLRLAHALLNNLATRLREEDPKLSWIQAYRIAVDKFVE